MPLFAKKILNLIGKRAFVNRLNILDNSKEGLIGVTLENDRLDVDLEQKILDDSKLTYIKMKAGRTDPKNRKIKFKGIFPDDMEIPALSSTFNVDVRPPKEFVHPNGIKRIKVISFGTKEKFVPVINKLCDDDGLKLFIGKGVKDLVFEYTEKSIREKI